MIFSNLSNPQSWGWTVTDSDILPINVNVSNSWFIGNRCEDAPNTIRGTCIIDVCF